ncbi:MAG: DUF5719 family protein [Microthrixaceae bacterium]
MRALRVLLVLGVVAALAALVVLGGDGSGPTPAALDRPAVPAAPGDGTVSGTWYCVAGTDGRAQAPTHEVVVTNPTPRPVPVTLTAYGASGPRPPVSVDVPAASPYVVDVDTTFGEAGLSVMVESPSGSVVAAHRLLSGGAGDQESCATSTSDAVWFPALATSRGASAVLTLFNPFASDAGVDVSVVLDSGVRTPSELTGVVVPAGTVKVLDLSQSVQRRDQFALQVTSRSGRVLAEATQGFDGSTGPVGLRLELGVNGPAPAWAFAGGFTGAGATEQVVVVNPSERKAKVEVQVTTFGAVDNAPEPITLDVAPLRYAVVDLTTEGRVSGTGYHSIVVRSPDVDVVAARLTSVTGPPAAPPEPDVAVRPAVTSGVAVGTGSSIAAGRWIVPAVDAGAEPAPVVFVHNPGRGIALVSTTLIGGDGTSSEVEVPAGDSVAVSVPGPAGGTVTGVELTSMTPLVVEQLATFGDTDLSFNLAVPARSRTGVVGLG